MGQIGRTALKEYFESGKVPTEAQFIDLIDSLLNTTDDTTNDITEATDKNYVTDAEKTVIGNTSGTNTGDQDLSGKENTGVAQGLLTTHETTHPAPTTRDSRNQVAGSYEPAKGTDDNFVTDDEKVIIGNTSGTNTGDAPADDTAYDETSWNANTDAATKNAIRDQVETMNTATAAKADPVLISGTHTDSVLTIPFATTQGWAITLAADRAYNQPTGLTSSNGVGVLEITHAGFTPTFAGITSAEDLVDRGGVYYLKFTRQPSGNIIQTNQAGGSSYDVTNTQLNEIKAYHDDFVAGKPFAINLSISGTEEKNSVLTANYTYFDPSANAESGTTFKWYRADDTSGTNRTEISGATSSTYTLVSADVDKYIESEVTPINASETGSAYLTGYSGQIGGEIIINDDFLTMQLWADSSVPDGWTKGGTHDATNKVEENAGGCRMISDSNNIDIRQLSSIVNTNDYRLTVNIDSVVSNGITVYDATTTHGNITTQGETIIEFTATNNHFILARFGPPTDIVIRSCKLEEV